MSKTRDDKLVAAIKFIRGCGAQEIQVRYSDDEPPTIWMVIATFNGTNPHGIVGVEVEAAVEPLIAALRLCEKLADGSMCLHCEKPVGFEPDLLLRMPFDKQICWYQFDPELKTFRRGCE